MMLLVSGEGPSDIGSCRIAASTCEGDDFAPGPMSMLIDRLTAPIWGFSPRDTGAMVFTSEVELSRRSRDLKPLPKQISLPGAKRAQETGFFYKNARALGRMAKERAAADGCSVGAVLFRDTDGTHSAPATLRATVVTSIVQGFAAEEFTLGVPMVPQPKSEAWLLCALQEHPYTNCARFEALPGNDAADGDGKTLLAARLAALGKTIDDLPEMVADGTISATRIGMPSYGEFRERMEEVANLMVRG